jgi:hypothetical protein
MADTCKCYRNFKKRTGNDADCIQILIISPAGFKYLSLSIASGLNYP